MLIMPSLSTLRDTCLRRSQEDFRKTGRDTNEVKVISHVENVHPSEGALRELKEKSPEEIAEEIIQFIEKEFPEAIEIGGGLHEAKTFFWMKKRFTGRMRGGS